ncbi:MAG: metal-dependent transcriptional regulator [Chloroflexi bacterium]|nr:metal-dependent transcriptional regulator [Chloroflexota bacterium]MBV9595732.1 metal-dependent transcriptional regulator [Chloroflexota bacterium]
MRPTLAGEASKSPTPVVEDYLQVLHYLTRDGYPVIAARLAERLNVSAPTVTATLQRMERDGLIEHGARKEILFTREGRAAAENIVRRHALAERLLTDLLKMPWYESHEEAHGVEHALTPNMEARLLRALGNPTTCPHGNPIPGLGRLAPDEFPLDEAHAGDSLTIQRITEEAEEDPRLMKYLQEHGVEPGVQMTVREAETLNATVVLDGPHGPVSLGFGIAAKLRARRT